jgi:hypothetical protein
MDTGKTSGFGIGELGSVPESTPYDDVVAAEIAAKQETSWARLCQRKATCTENVSTVRGEHVPCGRPVSERVYFSHTMGCCVMCEHHWIAYHGKRYPEAELTFEGIMAAIEVERKAEEARVKRCAVCGSADAVWNSGAGRDLCRRHWDSY